MYNARTILFLKKRGIDCSVLFFKVIYDFSHIFWKAAIFKIVVSQIIKKDILTRKCNPMAKCKSYYVYTPKILCVVVLNRITI